MYSKLRLFELKCNKFYCNLTFYKLNTYLILTSAWFGFVEQKHRPTNLLIKTFLVEK